MIEPLKEIPADPRLKAALAAYQAAPPKLQEAWAGAYEEALPKARFLRGVPILPAGRYGPVATMMAALLGLAQSGGLDGALVAGNHRFYETNYTKPLLFLSGGEYFEERAESQHLLGTQWGMMNETGSFPGQVWLWLYTFWYQIEPLKASPNADLLVFLDHGHPQPRPDLHPVHPRPAGPTPPPARLPRDLARALPRSRGLSRSRGPGQLGPPAGSGGSDRDDEHEQEQGL